MRVVNTPLKVTWTLAISC